LLALVCAAIVVIAAGCGPLGDEDDEEPTSRASGTASPVATPHGGSGQSSGGTPRAGATEPGAEDGTPAGGATRTPSPRASEEASANATRASQTTPTPLSVEGCEEPEELPEVQGRRMRQTAAEADEGVNLRAGPGPDCDIVQTLAPGTPVEVRSGPVRAGDIVWVKVKVGDTEGWVSEELLEPAPD
jgi:hypothetical protein